MELIKIQTNDNGQQVVSARDLHQFLIKDSKTNDVGRDFSHWIKEKLAYGYTLGIDYTTIGYNYLGQIVEENGVVKNGESDNQSFMVHKRDYVLTLDVAKEFAMTQKNDKGKEARQYFIECEKQLKNNSFKIPQTFKEALLLAVEQQEIIEKQEEEKKLLQAKSNKLEVKLDVLLTWVSIIKVSNHNAVKETYFNWRKLKSESKKLGYEIKKAESPRFGYMNLYHVNVFKSAYPELDYNIKDTI